MTALSSHANLRARFRAERQSLARLAYGNIARLLDGGIAPSGLPYLVMEYIERAAIGVFSERAGLTVADRLRLFQQVCAAVQYAHQNLIVHRDIKPANIMVTQDGTPKLLDFGIAKLLRSDTLNQTIPLTRPADRLMTPEYASPEQIRGEPVTQQRTFMRWAWSFMNWFLEKDRPAERTSPRPRLNE